jgi:hypothetical protein|tara:strand:+ start:481 stop:678 length:198 start_codon:yes stop_codon:yes gene_type:complete
MGEKVKIKVEKKLHDGEIVRIEELHFEIPKQIIEELQWDDGTLVEWETNNDKVVLRNIDDKILGD